MLQVCYEDIAAVEFHLYAFFTEGEIPREQFLVTSS